jgi:type IX secretion system PorP/SprF family membrane protein
VRAGNSKRTSALDADRVRLLSIPWYSEQKSVILAISKTCPMTGLRLLTVCLFLFSAVTAFAQQLSLFTQYRENLTVINPAGIESDFFAFGSPFTIGATYRSQWTGLKNGPRTQTLRASYLYDGGGSVALNFGGYIINDQTGPTGFTGIYGKIGGVLTDDAQYGGLSIALTAGFTQYQVRSSEIILRDANDPLAGDNQGQMFPDVGVGLFMYKAVGGRFADDYMYAGVSVPQVIGLDLTFQNDKGQFLTKRIQHFYGQFGYYKFFNNESFLEPSIWVKYAPNAPINVDANLRYQLPSALWIGAGGSSAGTAHLEAGIFMGDNVGNNNILRIGYGFDHNFSSFGPIAGSTHEINLSLSLRN